MRIGERDLPVIDLMTQVYPDGIGFALPLPFEAVRDDYSRDTWPSPAMVGYMFPGAAQGETLNKVDEIVADFDRFGIEAGHITVPANDLPALADALGEHQDRFCFAVGVNPQGGMRSLRQFEDLVRRYPRIVSCVFTSHFTYPVIAPNDKACYPLYAKCIELDLPLSTYVGIPAPCVPSWAQDPMWLDEVCWFFPELTVVMRHGGEPWIEMCVKLMLKWPNLYYATSGFAPKYFPKAILDYANTRGSDKILFSGYFPILTYEQLVPQLTALGLRDHVWPKFLAENARKVFRMDRLKPAP